MFAAAYAIARQFTFPVIISSKIVTGECNAVIGAFVVINEDGWFVTANHIIEQFQNLQASLAGYHALLAERKRIEEDTTIKRGEQIRLLNTMKVQPNAITHCSIWLGWDYVTFNEIHAITAIDLAVGRLTNFNKSNVGTFPLFKDPSGPMPIGTSLCKLGYPFHTIKPSFDEKAAVFILPAGAVPPPLFPMEGIYTRTIHIKTDPPHSYPLEYIETSSPGLAGQSGGPVFDVQGAIWAIQSKTQHLPLSFGDAAATGKDAEHLRHQYLNVGWAIHAQTILSLFKEKGIAYGTTANDELK